MNTDSTHVAHTDFAQFLQQRIDSRLKPLGYTFDARLRFGSELFGFSKPFGNDVYAIVQFQRHAHATNDEFTINLLRVKAPQLSPRVFEGYDRARGARLSYVLWFIHNLRIYPQADHWWAATEIDDALDQLIAYGLPWLADEDSKKPWEMPAHDGVEFVAAVQAIVAPELEALGFRSAVQTLAGKFAYPYFVKPLPRGDFGLIEFQAAYSLDPDLFQFDVRLQRTAADDPLDFNGHYRDWCAASLGQLVWQGRNASDAPITVEAVKALLWRYADQAELTDQLRAVVGHLRQIALPWFEAAGR